MKLPETLVTPGFVDFHTHLRDPSNSEAETMHTGTLAAVEGGYVAIKDMPNNPGMPTWSVERMLAKHARINEDAIIYVGCAAGSQPESDNIGELAGMAPLALDLKLYGAPTTGNDKEYEASDFEEIVKEWHRVAPDKPIGFHAGKHNTEDMINLVAGKYGHALHLCHVNNIRDAKLKIDAQKKGLMVTDAVTIHHLLKTFFDTRTEGWFARMQPPLVDGDVAAQLMRYLANNAIDMIETDHAPHLKDGKLIAEEKNPNGIHDSEHTTCFGVEGIEFAFALMAYQVYRDHITMERVIDAMSTQPAKLLGLKIAPNTRTTWDMRLYRIDDEKHMVKSQAGWTPYIGKMAMGVMQKVEIKGKTVAAAHNQQFDVLKGSRVITDRGTEV